MRKGKEELSKEKLTSTLPLQTPRAETVERITGLSHGGQEAGVLTTSYHFSLVEDCSWGFNCLDLLGSPLGGYRSLLYKIRSL